MTPLERKHFRSQAYSLKPVVATGQSGLTANVILAIEEALDHHELIKIRLRTDRREDKKSQAGQICITTGAELVQMIGNIAILYRKKPHNSD